jgi:PepSY-associated transmembrane protein
MVPLRKFLILTHRYLGIAVCLLFVMWFVSGIAMIFARGMPGLTPDVRLQHLPSLMPAAVKLTPAEAVEKAMLDRAPNRATLLTVMDRPAYRLFSGRSNVTVFADNGDVLEVVGQAEAMKIAARFMNVPETQLRYAGEIQEPDQWTLEERRVLPAHKINVADSSGTELYVSEETAEVALLTTRGSRALAWFAAIPHWMYFAPLRQNGPLWRQVVLWTSGIATVLALLGIALGFTQYSTRYVGIMRWHYWTGIAFGLFSLTWVFSGLLSMEPFFWASEGGTGNRIPQALRGGALDLAKFPNIAAPGANIKEVEFLRIQGGAYHLIRSDSSEPLLIPAGTAEVRKEAFSTESVIERVKQGNPDVPISEWTLLSDYDSYYHPSERKPPLPVLRVKFSDPDATWFYIDPHMSQVVTRFTRRERLQRWIYHGFHSLDFNFWYYQGPVWQITMVLLNAGGAFLSVIGVIIATKRVTRKVKRWTRRRVAVEVRS